MGLMLFFFFNVCRRTGVGVGAAAEGRRGAEYGTLPVSAGCSLSPHTAGVKLIIHPSKTPMFQNCLEDEGIMVRLL